MSRTVLLLGSKTERSMEPDSMSGGVSSVMAIGGGIFNIWNHKQWKDFIRSWEFLGELFFCTAPRTVCTGEYLRLHRWVKNGSFYFRAHKIETVPNSSGWDCYISGVFQTLCNQCGIHLSKCGLLRSNIIYHDKQNNTCMIECTDCKRYNNKERMSNIFIVIYSSTLDQYNSLDINVWIIN